jgi:hypothetical protein
MKLLLLFLFIGCSSKPVYIEHEFENEDLDLLLKEYEKKDKKRK